MFNHGPAIKREREWGWLRPPHKAAPCHGPSGLVVRICDRRSWFQIPEILSMNGLKLLPLFFPFWYHCHKLNLLSHIVLGIWEFNHWNLLYDRYQSVQEVPAFTNVTLMSQWTLQIPSISLLYECLSGNHTPGMVGQATLSQNGCLFALPLRDTSVNTDYRAYLVLQEHQIL